MKLSCLQENLNWGLAVVGRAVAKNTTLPITNNILLATNNGRLKLVATDLEKAVTCWIGAKVEEEGTITLPARLLTEFVGQLKEKEVVNLVMAPKTKTLSLKCARDAATISGLDAKDFPPIPSIEQGVNTSVEIEAFRQAITQVEFSTAHDQSRPVLTGVDIIMEGEIMKLAGADGFRLAVYKLNLVKPVEKKVEVIIPVQTMTELKTLMANEKEPVQITINPNKSQILFRLKDTELVSTLMQGTFPQYEGLIPQSFNTKAIVSTKEFLMAVKAASIFARERGGIVRVKVTPGSELAPGKMMILASSEDVGDNQGEIDAIVEGGEAKIAFKGTYMIDGLNVLKEDRVSFETTSPSSPIVVRPVGTDNYSYMVMPMFVQW